MKTPRVICNACGDELEIKNNYISDGCVVDTKPGDHIIVVHPCKDPTLHHYPPLTPKGKCRSVKWVKR